MVFTTNEHKQLRRVFEAVVSDVAPAPDLEWLTDSGLAARAEPRTAKVRRPGFAIATTIGVVALVTGLVLALTRGGERLAGDVGGDDGSFPYLLIDVGQLDESLALVSAFDQESSVDSPDRLRAFGLPEASLTSARIWFVSVPGGSDFFRGGEFEEPGWDPIPVEKGRAFIRTGPVGSSVMWETGDPGGEVVFAHAFMVDPAVLIDVISGVEKDDSGWGPRFLPDGFIELYAGPARADVERLIAQSWTNLEEGDGSAIELYLIDRGRGGSEQALNELLGFTVSELEIGATEVRGKPALVYAIGNETIYQWMETATVAVRVVIRGPIDPESVIGALVLVDQTTWDAAMSDAIDAEDLQPQSIDRPDLSQLPPRGSAAAEFLAADLGPPAWYTPPPNPIFSTYELAFEYGPDRVLRVEWIEDDDPALFLSRLTPGYTLESIGGIEVAVVHDFAGVQINVHPGDVWVRVSVDVASIPPSSRIEAAEASEIKEFVFKKLPGLLSALGV